MSALIKLKFRRAENQKISNIRKDVKRLQLLQPWITESSMMSDTIMP
ncbi:MAG: hypothetical protein ACO3RV_02215 [Luteolibacter sp.]|jgi:hypothetical protein